MSKTSQKLKTCNFHFGVVQEGEKNTFIKILHYGTILSKKKQKAND